MGPSRSNPFSRVHDKHWIKGLLSHFYSAKWDAMEERFYPSQLLCMEALWVFPYQTHLKGLLQMKTSLQQTIYPSVWDPLMGYLTQPSRWKIFYTTLFIKWESLATTLLSKCKCLISLQEGIFKSIAKYALGEPLDHMSEGDAEVHLKSSQARSHKSTSREISALISLVQRPGNCLWSYALSFFFFCTQIGF